MHVAHWPMAMVHGAGGTKTVVRGPRITRFLLVKAIVVLIQDSGFPSSLPGGLELYNDLVRNQSSSRGPQGRWNIGCWKKIMFQQPGNLLGTAPGFRGGIKGPEASLCLSLSPARLPKSGYSARQPSNNGAPWHTRDDPWVKATRTYGPTKSQGPGRAVVRCQDRDFSQIFSKRNSSCDAMSPWSINKSRHTLFPRLRPVIVSPPRRPPSVSFTGFVTHPAPRPSTWLIAAGDRAD